MYCKILKLHYNWCDKTSDNFEDCQKEFERWYKYCWSI